MITNEQLDILLNFMISLANEYCKEREQRELFPREIKLLKSTLRARALIHFESLKDISMPIIKELFRKGGL